MSSNADARSRADALLAPMEITPVRRVAAELYIEQRSTGLADQQMLTRALGLDAGPGRRPRRSAPRRAEPDDFRRNRRGRA